MIDDDPSPSSRQKEASRNEIFVPTSDSGLSRDNRRDESETPSSFPLSVSFPETGLSPVYRGAYDKACRLSMSNSAVKAPGKHEGYLTESESATAPNFVEVKRGRCCVCPCRAYKVSSMCSHALAVADIAGCLEECLVWYHTKSGGANLTTTASITAPKNSGMKPERSRRQRPCRKRCSE